ncbi:MAG: cytochrome c3 family protein [Planctomycetes bacterium]|nr:cytochrome c3 family protein [Planctomycetota bacterium]
MAQIFHPAANPFARFSIFGAVFLAIGALWLTGAITRSAWFTRSNVARDQPVPFTHELHSGKLGLDCRYCHTSVEESPFAGLPPTQTCMNCHTQIWADAPMLEPVRQSWQTGRPIAWTRVYDLADFCAFDHSIHLRKGIGCSTCHGSVDRMPLMWQTVSLFMEWCLDCHRQPERFIRPREAVFRMDDEPPLDQPRIGRELVERYHVRPSTDCTTCHR